MNRLDARFIKASEAPGAGEIPILNANGQLQLPFAPTSILVNGQDLMYRRFYVDAINGDDNNDGSESSPFKTIQKAVDSIPVGGVGNIEVKSDYTFDTDVDIKDKFVRLSLHGTLTFTWGNRPNGGNNYAGIFGITLSEHAYLYVWLNSSAGGKIVVEENMTGIANINEFYKEAIRIRELCLVGGVYFELRVMVDDYNPITVKDGGLIGILQWSNYRPNFMSVNFSGHYSGTNRSIKVNTSNNAYLVDFKGACGAFRWYYDGGLTDLDGNNIAVTDVVKGIIKDANGVPRNILSNIVF